MKSQMMVYRINDVEPVPGIRDSVKLEYFVIVVKDVLIDGIWSDVDDCYVGVFDLEDSTDLQVLKVLKFLC